MSDQYSQSDGSSCEPGRDGCMPAPPVWGATLVDHRDGSPVHVLGVSLRVQLLAGRLCGGSVAASLLSDYSHRAHFSMVEALDLDDHRTHCWVQTRDARLECDERLLVSGASTSQGCSKAADAVLAGADGRTRQTAQGR